MTRILDTTPTFEAFARKAGMESPFTRELMWKERYEREHADVFAAFNARHGSSGGVSALVRELSRVRARVAEAAPVMREAITTVDPLLSAILGVPAEPEPVHVLMVGPFSTNAAVAALGDDVAVFHCLEWFQSAEGAAVLVAHEGTHAWHDLALARNHPAALAPPVDDLAWTIFSEGVATQASRAALPDQPEIEYFWFGHPETDDWLPWCREHRGELAKHLKASLDLPEATETFFGGGAVDGHWRVGYELADFLVAGLGRSLPELVAMSVDEARSVVTEALHQAARA